MQAQGEVELKRQLSQKLLVHHIPHSNLCSEFLAHADGGVHAGSSSEPNNAHGKQEDANIRAKPIGEWLTAN